MLDGDDALTFGPADLMVIKRTRGASGHSPVVIGMVWAERMKCEWLKLKFTTSLKQRVPAPCSITKKPFTINTVTSRAAEFVASLRTQLKTVPECQYVSEASASRMRDCCDISYDYYYMQPSLCCYIRQALTLGNQPSRASVGVCAVRCK